MMVGSSQSGVWPAGPCVSEGAIGARRQEGVVMRVLRGAPAGLVALETGQPVGRINVWCAAFLAAGRGALGAPSPPPAASPITGESE
jgi:hypothetical protein